MTVQAALELRHLFPRRLHRPEHHRDRRPLHRLCLQIFHRRFEFWEAVVVVVVVVEVVVGFPCLSL
jgi:hypothetical protein